MKEQELKISSGNILSELRKLVQQEFAPRANQYDTLYGFPKENFQSLFRSGFLAATVSEEFGGMGLGNNKGNVRTLWAMTTEIARADMSTARCWEGHNNALMLLDNLGTFSQKEK